MIFFSERSKRLSLYLLGLLLVFVPYLSVLAHSDLAILFRDISQNEIPMRRLLVTAFLELGRIPHWNPYAFSGIPFLADCNMRSLFPINWLFYFFREENFARLNTYSIVLHHLLLYGAALFYFRHFRVRPTLAVFGAMLITCGGFAMSTDNFLNLLGAQIAIPFFIVFWRKSFQRPKISPYFFLASLALATPIYAADPQFSYVGAGLAVLLIWRAKLPFIESLQRVALLALLAVLSAGPQLLPTMAYVAETSRGFANLSLDQLTVWSLHGARLGEMIFPLAFGYRPDSSAFWGHIFLNNGIKTQPFIFSTYVGALVPFFLGVMSMANLQSRKPKRRLRFLLWAGVAAFSVLVTMGDFAPVPLYRILARVVPLWSSFRYPERLAYWPWFLFLTFGVLGVEKTLRLVFLGAKLSLWRAMGCLTLLGIGFAVFLRAHDASIYPVISTLFFTGTCLLLLLRAQRTRCLRWLGAAILLLGIVDILVVAQQLVWPSPIAMADGKAMPWLQNILLDQKSNLSAVSRGGARRFFSTNEADITKLDFLPKEMGEFDRSIAMQWGLLQPNISNYFSLEDVRGYFTFNTADSTKFLKLWETRPRLLLDILSVRYMLFMQDGFPVTRVNERAMPYAFVPPKLELFSSIDNVLARIHESSWNPLASTLLEGERVDLAPGVEGAEARVLELKKAWDDIFVKVAPANGGWLVLNESFHHNWRVLFNGREGGPIYRANGWAMAVPLPKENGSEPILVQFRYRDPFFVPGLVCLGLWIVGFAVGLYFFRSRASAI